MRSAVDQPDRALLTAMDKPEPPLKARHVPAIVAIVMVLILSIAAYVRAHRQAKLDAPASGETR